MRCGPRTKDLLGLVLPGLLRTNDKSETCTREPYPSRSLCCHVEMFKCLYKLFITYMRDQQNPCGLSVSAFSLSLFSATLLSNSGHPYFSVSAPLPPPPPPSFVTLPSLPPPPPLYLVPFLSLESDPPSISGVPPSLLPFVSLVPLLSLESDLPSISGVPLSLCSPLYLWSPSVSGVWSPFYISLVFPSVFAPLCISGLPFVSSFTLSLTRRGIVQSTIARVPECLSLRPNWLLRPLSRKRVCPRLDQRLGGGATFACLRVRGANSSPSIDSPSSDYGPISRSLKMIQTPPPLPPNHTLHPVWVTYVCDHENLGCFISSAVVFRIRIFPCQNLQKGSQITGIGSRRSALISF
jgi:hypothetical protein